MNITIKPSSFCAALRNSPMPYPCKSEIDGPFTVVIVDDDPGVLRSLARFVSAAGYEVQTFSSADELLTSLSMTNVR